ncbi:unnamed protein product [Agarophyton chilense]
MQRHPSGCDPQAFRGHHSIPAPTRNARPPSSLDPVLETLPGMQIALGELERSGPSLFRGTIEKTNLNRLANDLTEILVRHVNRLRLHAKIVAQTPHKQDTPNLDEIITPRKRTRPLRYCEESESPTNRYHVSERRSNHYHIDRDTQTFPRTRSLSTRIENRRSHRKRRLTRFAALEENSDDDDVREVHHVQRPRRSKEIRHNLSDDLAYEIMEQSARRKEEQQKRHREIIQAEKEAAVVVEESSDEDDDEGFVPKVVCPKLYVRERALQSDFASLTPMITDPDDDTDTELFRKWNARRTRKIVHDDITDEQPVQKQSDIFPFGRKTRLLRDVIVDVDLMKKLAREGLHHKSVGSILYTLPAIPRHYLDTGGRHWTDFDITEGFRKAPSKTPFVRSMFKRPITATKPDAVMNNATARDKLSAMREQASHKPSAKASLPLPEHTPVLKEPNPLIQATNVDTGVSTRPVQAHAQDHTDIASSRKLEELYQALLKQVEQVPTQTNLPDDGMMKSKSIDPADMERALDIRKTRAHHPLSSRTIPAMRQAVGLHANQAEQHSSTGIMQRTQKPQSQVSTDPIVLQRPQTNAYQHDHGMQLNPLFALGSNQGGTSQLHPQQLQKQVQPILEHQQESVSAPIPAEQRNVSPAGSQMLASNEVNQQVGQEQVARQYESQATPLSEHHDQPQRLPSDGNHKKKGYQAEMRTANGIVSSKAPLHSSAVEKKGTQPLLPCTQTGSSTEHEGNGRQVAQTPSHPSSGIKTSSMNGPKFPLQTDADVKTVTNEPRAHLVATSETTPEVQLGSTQPSRIPNSTGKGVQGWSWKRQDCVTEQPNGHGAVPSEHPESRTTTHDQTQAPLGHDTARDDQRRRYEEDYRAAYELQLRKVMEEIRKKNENGDPGLE